MKFAHIYLFIKEHETKLENEATNKQTNQNQY